MQPSSRKITFKWWTLLIISLYLAAMMLYKGTVPAPGTYPSKAVVYLTLVFQLAMSVGIIGLRSSLKAALPPADTRRRHIDWLFWLGIVASVLLLVFRFFGQDAYAAWYTGHFWRYQM